MAADDTFGLNRLARLREEQRLEARLLDLDPEFPYVIQAFDPEFFSKFTSGDQGVVQISLAEPAS